MSKEKRWNALHYNAVAKEICDLFPVDYVDIEKSERDRNVIRRGTLAALAISFATRFQQDWLEAEEGLQFDPLKFLDQCSPDPEKYPLSELWERPEGA